MTPARPRTYALAWIALLVLLGATCASAFVPMGRWNAVTNLAIAAIKALIVALVFMHLPRGRPITWIVAAAGVLWLALLAGLSAFDFALRL